MPGTESICHVTNNVSRIFPRYWWYHDVAVSMLALQREREGEIKLNMGQFTAKTLLIWILTHPE